MFAVVSCVVEKGATFEEGGASSVGGGAGTGEGVYWVVVQ